MQFKDGVWDARVSFDYPLDFSHQWTLWEEGKFGDTRLLYSRSADEKYRDTLRDLSLDKADLRGMKILEVGFGDGRLLHSIQADCPTAFGIDLVKPLLSAKLRQRSVICASLFNNPFKPMQFDLVICRGVIHHTGKTRLAFSRVAEQVGKSGKLYLFVYEKDVSILTLRKIMPFSWILPEGVRLRLSRFIGLIVGFVFALRRRELNLDGIRKYWGNYSLMAFDLLSARYTSWHSPDEIVSWFKETSFEVERVGPCVYVGSKC